MLMIRRLAAVGMVLLLLSPATTRASDFSDLTGIDVNVAEGTIHVDPPRIQDIPQRVQTFVNKLPESINGAVRDLFNPAGAALAFAIRNARAQAINGAKPIPDAVRRELQGIVPDQVLNDVHWNTLDSNRIDLADLTLLHNNDVAAITVGNVIVFDRTEDAELNWRLWAHELFHTVQYSQMGIEAFAHAYVLSSDDIEQPARNFASMVEQKHNQRRQGDPIEQIGYDGASSANPERYFSEFQSAMQRVAPATSCLDIRDNGGRPTVTNVCSTAVWVSTFVEVNRVTGQAFRGVCTPGPYITCEIRGGTTLPVITPMGGCVREVQFSFFSDGANAESGTWEGYCDDVVPPPPQLGRSCCMFNGQRCGPFFNQPAQPIGSACSCQYGNPYANGQVCP